MSHDPHPLQKVALADSAPVEAGFETAKKPGAETAAAPTARSCRFCYAVLLVAVILFFGFIRYRLRTFPLERDEGEYAYAAQLLLHGISPYRFAYTMKLPGTAAAYAAILSIFGQTPAGIHLGLLFVNAITTVVIYLLTARLFGQLAGVVAAASFAVLSVSPSVLGMAGHATHFVLLPALAGLLLLEIALDRARLWLFACSGLLLGAAFLMKQPGIVFAVFGALCIVGREYLQPNREWRRMSLRLGIFLAGVAVPFGLTCLLIALGGSFRPFWFWTVSYARAYGTELSIRDGVTVLRQVFPGIVAPAVWIWRLAAVGIAAMLVDKTARLHAGFVGGFVLFSSLAVCPGFYFREHYFILVLPAVALLTGVAVSSATRALRSKGLIRAIPLLIFISAFGYSLFQQKAFFFTEDPVAACRRIYRGNPFVEAPQIADYIKAHSLPGETVAVLGSEPEIYFYSGRRSATGYIYTYGLMEPQKYALTMQEEMAGEIEASHPRYIVAVRVPTSWLFHPDSQRWIFSWWNQYIHDYELVGVAEVGSPSRYAWDDEIKNYVPHSPFVVYTFRRKS